MPKTTKNTVNFVTSYMRETIHHHNES